MVSTAHQPLLEQRGGRKELREELTDKLFLTLL